MQSARTFIALPLSPREQRKLFAIARSLAMRSTSLVKPENYHLTLCFLGNCRPRFLVSVRYQLAEIKIPAFALRIVSLARFPGGKSPVIAAIPAQSSALDDLHHQVVRQLLQIGFSPERRPFRPHITLGRCRHRLAQLPVTASMTIRAKQFDLLRSESSPTGSIYSPLAVYRLH